MFKVRNRKCIASNSTYDCAQPSLRSVSSNRNLDIGAGRGDGTSVVLTYIHSRKRRLIHLWTRSLLRSRNPEIELKTLSLKEQSFASILVTAASLRTSYGAVWFTPRATSFRDPRDQCSVSSLSHTTRLLPQSGIALQKRPSTAMLDFRSQAGSRGCRSAVTGKLELYLIKHSLQSWRTPLWGLSRAQGDETTMARAL